MSDFRERVFEKYDGECWFCSIDNDQHKDKYGRSLSVHHFVPKVIGGPNTVENCALLCCSCHQKLTVKYDEMLFALFQDYRELTESTKHLEGETIMNRERAVLK